MEKATNKFLMEENQKTKKDKALIITGSSLLIIMAIFHGSGFTYITALITKSNSEELIKEILPVLFLHPSIHLIGLATLGIGSIFMRDGTKKLLKILSVLIIIDALLAFYLGGVLPGILLILAALSFTIAGVSMNKR